MKFENTFDAGSLLSIFWLFIHIPLALLCVLNELFPRFSHINRSNFFPLMCISHGSLSLIPGYHIMTIFIISTPTILKTKGKSKYVHTSFKYQLPKFSHVQTNLFKQKIDGNWEKIWSHISLINYVSRNQLHNTANGCQNLNFYLL